MSDDLMDEFTAHRDAAMKENEARLDERFDAAITRFPDELRVAWPEAAAISSEALRWREVSRGHSAGGALCELVWEVGNEAVGRRTFRLAWSADARDWKWSPVAYTRERGYHAETDAVEVLRRKSEDPRTAVDLVSPVDLDSLS